MLDKYCFGEVSRISAEAPVPIVDIAKTISKPGGASNVAQNLSTLGMNVVLLGITGDDSDLKELIKVLRLSNIKFDPVKDLSVRTTVKLRVMGNNQHLIRLDHEDKNKSNMHDVLLKKIIKYLEKTDLVILSDYDKGVIKPIAKDIIEHANKKDIKVIIDPKGYDYSIYKNAYLVKPNENEFSLVVGESNTKRQMISNGKKLKKNLNLEALLLTLGRDGMMLFDKNNTYTFPTSQKEVFDVTGAGDTVISVIAASLASNLTLKKSCELANIAAGLSLQHLGTFSVTKSDIQNAIKKS